MPTTNKSDIIEHLGDSIGVTRGEANRVLEAVINVILEELAAGKSVSLRGFGTFQLKRAKAILGRNPSNPNEVIMIPERAMLRFRPSGALRTAVNSVPVDCVE